MMDAVILYGIMFLIGGVASRLIFGGVKVGPFEQSLMYNISLGKRVIISVDDDCHIFEMIDGKLRITRGITDFQEVAYGMEFGGVDSHAPDQSSSDPSDGT